MPDIYETIRKYMREGLTLNEAIPKAEGDLHTTFSPDMKARIRTEINFT